MPLSPRLVLLHGDLCFQDGKPLVVAIAHRLQGALCLLLTSVAGFFKLVTWFCSLKIERSKP